MQIEGVEVGEADGVGEEGGVEEGVVWARMMREIRG